jgi:hypothetical protein
MGEVLCERNAAMELGLIAKVAGRQSGMDKFSKI